MSEGHIEPIPGLPEELPDGEEILWQGAPDWKSLALHAFRVQWVAIYFAAFVIARAAGSLYEGAGLGEALAYAVSAVPFAAVGLGLLALLAWANARATLYTITNRRLVMRVGVAISFCVNLPFRRLGSAALDAHPDGTGDIALTLASEDRLAYIHMWPHTRPWHFSKTQPMLRCVPDAARVAGVLADAVANCEGARIALTATSREAAAKPGRPGLSGLAQAAK